MPHYAWATDIHLDFLQGDQRRLIAFSEKLIEKNPTGVLLTGDISVARELVFHLSAIERVVQRPIYFVLGNHDYYGSNTETIRKNMHELSNMSSFLKYMPTLPYHALTPSTALVGHDGWYDALYGDWQGSSFQMVDWNGIGDFRAVNGNKVTIVSTARKLAHEAITHVQHGIKQAVRYHKNVVILTHFPPFRESHVHKGRVGDDYSQPWFTSKMMGDMLLDASKTFPGINFTVLAGHTHGKWDGQVASNLMVHVGGAEYNEPALQGLVEIL